MYTIGPGYAHGEMRKVSRQAQRERGVARGKDGRTGNDWAGLRAQRLIVSDFVCYAQTKQSPVVDGVVARDPDQKELRLLTKLTEEEREIARGICVAFKQNSQDHTTVTAGVSFSRLPPSLSCLSPSGCCLLASLVPASLWLRHHSNG